MATVDLTKRRSSRPLAPKVTVMTVLAENFNRLCKTELIHGNGPRRNVEHMKWATLKCVDWFNNQRNDESHDYVPCPHAVRKATMTRHLATSNWLTRCSTSGSNRSSPKL